MNHKFSHQSQLPAQSKLTGWVLIFGVVLFFSVLAVLLLGLPDELGINIPSSNVESDYIWASTFSIAVLFCLFWLPLQSEERLALMIGWLAKSFVSLVMMLWYESYYYFLDAYSYFYNAQDYVFGADMVTFGDGTELVTMVCAVLIKVLPGGYHVVKEVFSLVGLAGIYCFYRSLVTISGIQKISWLVGLCLFPSICFWSSVIGKEPISLLGIGIFFLGGAKFYKRPEIGALLLILIGIFITGGIRLWLVMVMLPCFFVLLFASNIASLWRAWAFMLALFLGVVSINMVTDRFEFASRQEAFERLDQSARGWAGDGGSGQVTTTNFSNPAELVAFLPLGIFTALYRPLPGEITSLMGTLSALENIVLLLLTLRAIIRFNRHDLALPPVVFSLFFLALWLVLYAPVSYQNLGTAIRFKVQVLPILISLAIFFGRKRVGHHTMVVPNLN